MGRKQSANILTGLILVAGIAFIAAGAFVPSEETMALGFFLLLASSSVLLGLNWPEPRARDDRNLVSLQAFRAQQRSRV